MHASFFRFSLIWAAAAYIWAPPALATAQILVRWKKDLKAAMETRARARRTVPALLRSLPPPPPTLPATARRQRIARRWIRDSMLPRVDLMGMLRNALHLSFKTKEFYRPGTFGRRAGRQCVVVLARGRSLLHGVSSD
jgi:hypothetical protein